MGLVYASAHLPPPVAGTSREMPQTPGGRTHLLDRPPLPPAARQLRFRQLRGVPFICSARASTSSAACQAQTAAWLGALWAAGSRRRRTCQEDLHAVLLGYDRNRCCKMPAAPALLRIAAAAAQRA